MIVIEPIQRGMSLSSVQPASEGLDSLDESFVQALSDKMAVMHEMKVDINTLTKSAEQITDPATLIKLQAMLADYSLNVEFASRVAQRMIGAIDSLVRS